MKDIIEPFRYGKGGAVKCVFCDGVAKKVLVVTVEDMVGELPLCNSHYAPVKVTLERQVQRQLVNIIGQ